MAGTALVTTPHIWGAQDNFCRNALFSSVFSRRYRISCCDGGISGQGRDRNDILLGRLVCNKRNILPYPKEGGQSCFGRDHDASILFIELV